MLVITFRTYQNQNNFIFSVDRNDIFDHKHYIDPGIASTLTQNENFTLYLFE